MILLLRLATCATALATALRVSPAPMAYTSLGPLRGVSEDDHNVFRGVPYAQPPERFTRAQPPRAWGPAVRDAVEFGPGCVGSATVARESEDCLTLNIWLPKRENKHMPVIVYFHGGLNQHGSGWEELRQGDGITQSDTFPTIFVNFDYRLGIFGWIYGDKSLGVDNNLGLYDQQLALRWVHNNIAAFGGNPASITLMGQSEGAGNIMAHLVSPGSAGLFQRAIFHSPPADIWSRKANKDRTAFMLRRVGCQRNVPRDSLKCLKELPAAKLWAADWVSEELSRHVMSVTWRRTFSKMLLFAATKAGNLREMATYLGWHAVVDGESLPGEPRELIRQGRWNKVPILITVSKNESLGIYPGGSVALGVIRSTLGMLVKRGDLSKLEKQYAESLRATGLSTPSTFDLLHQMATDKLWTCEAWALAKEITMGGGSAQLGMFWYSPRYDPVGASTNEVCMRGATCHAAEMLFSLPQGHGRGIWASNAVMWKETAFAERYRDEVLAFVHGLGGPWVKYTPNVEAMTFYDENGPRVVEGYRKEQCAVLDGSMSETLPLFMRQRVPGGGF